MQFGSAINNRIKFCFSQISFCKFTIQELRFDFILVVFLLIRYDLHLLYMLNMW